MTKATLNEQIARALGWTGFHRWSAAPGKRFGLPPGTTHIGRNHENSAEVPDYAADLNATVAALPMGWELSVSKQGEHWHAGVEPVRQTTPPSGYGYAGTASAADSAAHALLRLLTDAAT